MTIEAAQILVEFSDQQLRLRENYSGRVMYGRTTAGVVGCEREWFEALGTVLTCGDDLERETVAEALENISRDSMAFDMIWY